jgi:hypothetical protein
MGMVCPLPMALALSRMPRKRGSLEVAVKIVLNKGGIHKMPFSKLAIIVINVSMMV